MIKKNKRIPKLLALAKDQACVMCGSQDGTVVSAHSNLLTHGRGHAHKAHDGMIAWLCYSCHYDYDHWGRMDKKEARDFILEAICKTYMEMWNLDLIQVKEKK